MYTSLIEAMNATHECLGNGQSLVGSRADGSDNSVQLTECVVAAVAAYVGNAKQSDDLTLLVVKRLPAVDEEIRVRLPAELECLPELLEPIRQAAERVGLAKAQVMRLELAVEEALVNLCNHAYADQTAPGPVYCRITMQPESLRVEIADEGPPFDPLARPDPDTTLELEDREPGGLGVFLIKTLVSEVDYRREEDRNILTLRMLKVRGQQPDE